MNTHFINSVTDEPAITEVAIFGFFDSGDDSAFPIDVFQGVEPFGKYAGSFKSDHVGIVFLGIQAGKPLFLAVCLSGLKEPKYWGEDVVKNSRLRPQKLQVNSQINSKSGKV